MNNDLFISKYKLLEHTYLVSIDKEFSIKAIATSYNLASSTVIGALSVLESENKIVSTTCGWALTIKGKKEMYG